MVKKFINVCFLIISIHAFIQGVIILTHSDVINMNNMISKKQMFDILLTVVSTTDVVKKKPGSVKIIHAKSTYSVETTREAEKTNLSYLHRGER